MQIIILKEHRTIYNTIFTTMTITIGQDIPNKYFHYFTTVYNIYYLQQLTTFTIYKQTLLRWKMTWGQMEIPSVILSTQHVGQNCLVPVDQV